MPFLTSGRRIIPLLHTLLDREDWVRAFLFKKKSRLRGKLQELSSGPFVTSGRRIIPLPRTLLNREDWVSASTFKKSALRPAVGSASPWRVAGFKRLRLKWKPSKSRYCRERARFSRVRSFRDPLSQARPVLFSKKQRFRSMNHTDGTGVLKIKKC